MRTKPTCKICGCDESRACLDDAGRTCGWIDEQRDLCSRCALVLYGLPIGAELHERAATEQNLSRLQRVVRVQRWLLGQVMRRVSEHDGMFALHDAAVFGAPAEPPEEPGEIWTPGQ